MMETRFEFDPEKHEYRIDGEVYPSVTQILKDAGVVDYRMNPAVAEFAMERGRAVHEATRLLDQGTLDDSTLDTRIEGYALAWLAFRDSTGFDPRQIETPLWSKAYRFAGTADRIGTLEGRPAILEIKTGHMPDWAGLQMAGYLLCTEPGFMARARRVGVELREDGRYSLTEFREVRDFGVFKAAVSIWHWKNGRRSA